MDKLRIFCVLEGKTTDVLREWSKTFISYFVYVRNKNPFEWVQDSNFQLVEPAILSVDLLL